MNAPRIANVVVTLGLVTLGLAGCKPGGSGSAPASARQDCDRVISLAEQERKKLPKPEELGTSRMQVNAALAVRDYASKLDQIAVNDKGLNNKLADYSDLLRKMAKSLDELWTARESEKKAAADKTLQIVTQESAMVADINTYCQTAR